ncbi:MAG: hypothetical protein ACQESI_02450 [Pseudomonadota bacterium]
MLKTIGLVAIIAVWAIYTQFLDSTPEDYSEPHQRIEFQAFDESGRKVDASLKAMLQGFPTRLYQHDSRKCETRLSTLDQDKIELAVFVTNKKRLSSPVQRVEAFCVESSGFDKECEDRIMAKMPQDASGIYMMQLMQYANEECTQERRITRIRTIYPF